MARVVIQAEALDVFGHIDHGGDVAQQFAREFFRMVYRAVVREVHGFGFEFEQAGDGVAHFLRLELRRRGGRENEYAIVNVQFAVGQAEHVSGEDAL